ncbi:MAG: PQQ-binding-like beta-propeller repeat protein [Planctomycetota bacterium]|jgi:outer membrane protein assembly factor BamB
MTLRLVISLLAVTVTAQSVQPVYAQAKDAPRAQDAKKAQDASKSQGLQWNQWRGPNRDGLSPDTGLLKKWPEDGPPLAWQTTDLGLGFSSVSFAGKHIYTMGDVDDAALLFSLRATDGKIEWSAKVGKPGGARNPGPRSTPSTDGKLVFGLGHDGALVCVRAATGKVKWRCNLDKDFGGKMMSGWGFSESPLLDGDLLVCTPGGRNGAVIALKKTTGKVVWRCKQLTDAAAYSSLVIAEIGGVRQYIVLTGRSVAGINAKNGKLLWHADRPGRTAVCTTPVYSDGYLFVTSGYNVGCNAFKITHKNRKFEVEEVYSGKQMQSHHGGVVLVGDHVYGLGRRNLKCIELKTGDVIWEKRSVGKGSIAYADGHLVVRSERGSGALALVEATPEGYREKGRFDQPERSEVPSWAHPVIFGGKLYIRDQDVLLCFDLKKKRKL